MINFPSLEVVDRVSETQLQVRELNCSALNDFDMLLIDVTFSH